METGFYDLYSIHLKQPDTYKPPYLYFNPIIRAYQDSTQDSILGEITYKKKAFRGDDEFDERTSLTFNCSDPVGELKFELLSGPVVYVSDPPIWCNTESFRMRKMCQLWIKPSVYTGKLRLFIQALYGSFRYDYSTVEESPFIEKPLFVQDIQIQYQYLYGSGGSGTHGIYTNEHLDYYLIHIKPSTISARRMIPKKEGKVILEKLRLDIEKNRINDDDRKKVEAYLLSTCEIDKDERTIARFDQLQGTPLHYGWHFNWDGSRADIILNTTNTTEDKLLYATHYRVEFSEIVRGDITCEISSNFKDMAWYGVGNKVVWKPDLLFHQMVAEVNPMSEELGFGWDIHVPPEWEAYIYCYYDIRDEFVLVGIGNKYDPGKFVPTTYYPSCGFFEGYKLYWSYEHWVGESDVSWVGVYREDGSTLYEYRYDTATIYNGQQVEYFVARGMGDYEQPYPLGSTRRLLNYDNNNRICGDIYYADYAYSLGLMKSPSEPSNTTGFKLTVGGEEYNEKICYNNKPMYPVDFYRVTGSESKDVSHTIAIPFADAEMVFLGEQIHNFFTELVDVQVWKNGYIVGDVIFTTYYTDDLGKDHVLNVHGPYTTRSTRLYDQATGDGAPFLPGSEDHIKAGTPEHKDIIDTPIEDWYAGSRWFTCLHVSDPTGYFYAEHRQSVQGAANPVYQDLFNEEDGYIYHTAVGWA